jgi:hypothetical protein
MQNYIKFLSYPLNSCHAESDYIHTKRATKNAEENLKTVHRYYRGDIVLAENRIKITFWFWQTHHEQ